MQVFQKIPGKFLLPKSVIHKTKIKNASRIHRLRRHTIYATIELKDIEKGKTQMFSVRGL